MNASEHLPHSSRTELRLQWIAIVCMAIGLIVSIYHHSHMIKAERIKSELTSYLHLNDRYNQLVFSLIQNDSEVFKKTDDLSLQKNKYVLYELFELLATVESLKGYFKELDKDTWPIWNRRMEFLFSKPAINFAWQQHQRYAKEIYRPEFIRLVDNVIAQNDIQD